VAIVRVGGTSNFFEKRGFTVTKILGIVGSQRPYANSRIIVESCLDEIKNSGLKTEIAYLHHLHINHCNGCLACVYKGRCPNDDDMPFLLKKIIEADGFVVAAPTYLFSPTSLIKKVIERCLMLTPFLDSLEKKVRNALCFSVAGKSEWNPLGLTQLSQLALAYGYNVLASREVIVSGPGEIILQENTLEEIKKLSQSLAASFQGTNNPLPAIPDSCPVCKNQVFRLKTNSQVQCAACGAEGVLDYGNNRLELKFSSLDQNFFTIPQRKNHAEKYMLESRAAFLKRREEIKLKLENRQ